MAYAGGSAAATAAAVAIAEATKASGVVVSMKPEEFMDLLHRIEEPLVVTATGGVLNKNFQYLVGYKGLAFFTKSSEKLPLPPDTELVAAGKIWIPG